MSEFEKKLNRIICNGVTIHDEKFYLFSNLVSFFKDWQPPKPLVVVPQCVADWFEENKHDLEFIVWQYINHWDNQEENEFKTFMDFNSNKPIQTIFKMLDGYTVKEEKKYILKHIDLSEQDDCVSVYLARHPYAKLKHDNYSKGFDMSEIIRCHFTQEEIDKLNIGSYEQIPVEMSDNGI